MNDLALEILAEAILREEFGLELELLIEGNQAHDAKGRFAKKGAGGGKAGATPKAKPKPSFAHLIPGAVAKMVAVAKGIIASGGSPEQARAEMQKVAKQIRLHSIKRDPKDFNWNLGSKPKSAPKSKTAGMKSHEIAQKAWKGTRAMRVKRELNKWGFGRP